LRVSGGAKAQGRLAKMQASDGHYPGADHSITRSGGNALEIETTALATLTLMKAPEEHPAEIQKGLDWMVKQRSGSGGFGYARPQGGRAFLGLAPTPSWREVQYRG